MDSANNSEQKEFRKFQDEILKTFVSVAGEIQSNRERISEIDRFVSGDSRESLYVQVQLMKRQLNYLESEMKQAQAHVENHIKEHSSVIVTRNERGWQIKVAIISALVGTLSSLLLPFMQYLAKQPVSNDSIENQNPWFED